VVSSDVIDYARGTYGLPSRYLFFPAQFWSHKNHVRVVEALGLLRRTRGIDVAVVMCGTAEGALRQAVLADVVAGASAAGVSDLVRILGYVPDSDMAALYQASAGVILPTFFGPTNIPVLEGWSMGVPVLTSDIRGIREQVGDAAVLVNPRSVESIANGIASIWLDEVLSSQLIAAGTSRLGSYGAHEYRLRLADIVDEAEARFRTEGSPHA
jgi:glycosyltransferase involved in cell wall biosynthesis